MPLRDVAQVAVEVVGEAVREPLNRWLAAKIARRRGESADAQWRRVGPWFGVPCLLLVGFLVTLCFVLPSLSPYPVVALGVLVVLAAVAALVPARWLVAVARGG